ncbi:hypothetical protein [Cellulomonas sp. Leaf395]|uniref:hypothetical protein n=1 Tax=Cellulomonas sp. Leaf395 TaxID=1736362 RepID=UPI000A583448|nr:hypothetical protein [Cellulomonas sp. Leaf395]
MHEVLSPTSAERDVDQVRATIDRIAVRLRTTQPTVAATDQPSSLVDAGTLASPIA